MNVLIKRQVQTNVQTTGKLSISNGQSVVFECFTLELPWRNNQQNVSCIPPGIYTIQPRFTQKHGQHWLVKDVPGRDHILIHRGNFHSHTRGCILTGKNLTDINADGYVDVTHSTKTLDEINQILGNEDHTLKIV